MLIDSDKLKQMIENQKANEETIIERCFNKGLDTANKLILILEGVEKRRQELKEQKRDTFANMFQDIFVPTMKGKNEN